MISLATSGCPVSNEFNNRFKGWTRFTCTCLICLYILRSEEHTSELQSRENLVCRLLLEKKNHRAGSRCRARQASQGIAERRPGLLHRAVRGRQSAPGGRDGAWPFWHRRRGGTDRRLGRRSKRPGRAFFLKVSAPSGIYTLSLHDALPI